MIFLLSFLLKFLSGPTPAAGPEPINWMTIEQAEEACRKKPRKVFIDVYTDWCGWCKKMDQSTFRDSAVAAFAGKQFYAVKLNAEDRSNLIFKNRVYAYNATMRSHDLAIALLNGQMSYPSLVFLDEKLNPIQTFGGFSDAGQFSMLLHYFHENAYRKKITLDDFSREFRKR